MEGFLCHCVQHCPDHVYVCNIYVNLRNKDLKRRKGMESRSQIGESEAVHSGRNLHVGHFRFVRETKGLRRWSVHTRVEVPLDKCSGKKKVKKKKKRYLPKVITSSWVWSEWGTQNQRLGEGRSLSGFDIQWGLRFVSRVVVGKGWGVCDCAVGNYHRREVQRQRSFHSHRDATDPSPHHCHPLRNLGGLLRSLQTQWDRFSPSSRLQNLNLDSSSSFNNKSVDADTSCRSWGRGAWYLAKLSFP